MEIVNVKVSLDDVIRYYVEGFKLEGNKTLFRYEAFVDPSKRVVWIEATLKDSSTEQADDE
ncbi:hypothetical protein [Cupriavidus basilensis]|uniref:hypothetical protein n=1 Tax=Cupriavidus basilensis TaxID=68895 RepID=UPI0007508541|nr:hypothetical protein [Cupriavidus basilensis]